VQKLFEHANTANEFAFAIFRRLGAGAYERIAVLAPNAQSYGDTTVSPKATYTYRLRATNNVGASDWSNEAAAATWPLWRSRHSVNRPLGATTMPPGASSQASIAGP
jgi:hypothetical protein